MQESGVGMLLILGRIFESIFTRVMDMIACVNCLKCLERASLLDRSDR